MLDLNIITEDKDLAVVCELYWEVNVALEFVHKTTDIATVAKIDKNKLPRLIKEICNAYVPSLLCEKCGIPYLLNSRSDFTRIRPYLIDCTSNRYSYICLECKNKEWERELRKKQQLAISARIAEEKANNEFRNNIRNRFDLNNRVPINFSGVELTNMVYLLSLLRVGANEDITIIKPISLFGQDLSPTNEYSTEIVERLLDSKLLFIHPESDPEAFSEKNLSSFYPLHVCFAPPISFIAPNDRASILSELLSEINNNWHNEWFQEAFNLWQRIALEECKQYLLFCMNEHHFEFNPGAKTTQYLRSALDNFSTGQVFNTIWRSTKDAAAFYQRGEIPKRQAANYAIASIQRISERAIAENWDLKPYGRNYKNPQSILSEVIYNVVLKIGNEGFYTVPSIEIIKELRSSITPVT